MAILGSSTITGDLAVTGNITGTFNGTATNALSATNATSAITATKWANSVNVTIKDNTGANTGSSIAINGDASSLTLKLPSTIKATLTGNAATATNATYAAKIGTDSSHSSIGGSNRPVYVNSNGVITYTNYIPKLNGSGQSSDASFYAPTSVGTSNYILKSNGSGAPTWTNAPTGLSSVSAGTFTATSDYRLKDNIKDWSPQKSILELPIKEFNFKLDGSHHIGCIAQDLQKICPELVHEDENGYLGIEESKLVYLLLDEIKKLKAEVLELKQKITERS